MPLIHIVAARDLGLTPGHSLTNGINRHSELKLESPRCQLVSLLRPSALTCWWK